MPDAPVEIRRPTKRTVVLAMVLAGVGSLLISKTIEYYRLKDQRELLVQVAAADGFTATDVDISQRHRTSRSPQITGDFTLTYAVDESAGPVTVSWMPYGEGRRLNRQVDVPDFGGHRLLIVRVILGPSGAEVRELPVSRMLDF